jgi:hypothetical protein
MVSSELWAGAGALALLGLLGFGAWRTLRRPRESRRGDGTGEAPATPHSTRPGDDGRRTSNRPPPPLHVVQTDDGARQPRTVRAWNADVEARVQELLQAARDSGKNVDHCLATEECHGLAGCTCACAPCVRRAGLEESAYLEVTGRPAV